MADLNDLIKDWDEIITRTTILENQFDQKLDTEKSKLQRKAWDEVALIINEYELKLTEVKTKLREEAIQEI